jgi:hypothetical protein
MRSSTQINAHGLTPKQELFAQLASRGKSLSDCYREAYSSVGNYKTVNDMASKIWSNPLIRQRVETLCEQQSAMLLRDSIAIRRHIFRRLLAESQSSENRGSERIAALALLGKIDSVGMFREIHSLERVEDRPPELIAEELQAKLAQFLREVPGEIEERSSEAASTEIVSDVLTQPVNTITAPIEDEERNGREHSE